MTSRIKHQGKLLFLLLSLILTACQMDPLANIDTEDKDALRRRGFELINEGRYNDAMEVFKFAVEKFPEEPYLFNGYGLAAERAGRVSLAVRKFRQACWIEPFNENFRNNFVRVYEKQQEQRPTDPGISDYATGSPHLDQLDRVRGTVSGVDQQMFERAVHLFRSRHNRLPENLEELVRAGIIGHDQLKDPFGRPYWSYRDNGSFIIRSSGQDMVMFTDYDRVIVIR